jgi:hypothetical protein
LVLRRAIDGQMILQGKGTPRKAGYDHHAHPLIASSTDEKSHCFLQRMQIFNPDVVSTFLPTFQCGTYIQSGTGAPHFRNTKLTQPSCEKAVWIPARFIGSGLPIDFRLAARIGRIAFLEFQMAFSVAVSGSLDMRKRLHGVHPVIVKVCLV